MAKFKLKSRKKVLKADLFTVIEDRIVFQNGKEVTWHNIEIDKTVFVLPITKDNEIYLISQYRYLAEKHYIEVIAGFVNEDEGLLDAAKRELKEETGVSAKSWQKMGVYNLASSVINNEMHYFVAKDLTEGDSKLDQGEEIEVVKMPIAEALEKVINGEIVNQNTMVGILLLNELIKRGKINL